MSVTIHDRLWSDTRFTALSNKIGKYKAIGMLVEFWKLAKRYWVKGNQHVPKIEYDILDPQYVLVKCEFAKVTETGIYCKGSESRFKKKTKSKAVTGPTPTSQTWDAYKASYVLRYGHEPVRNAMVNGQIANIVKRLGSDAPEVMRFYVAHGDSFYLKKGHAVGLALKDAESLRTQWKRGKAVTHSDVKQHESQTHFRDQMQRIKDGEL